MGRNSFRRAVDDEFATELIGEHATGQIVGGLVVIGLGLGSTWLLWEAGWIWTGTLLVVFVGAGWLGAGILAARREAHGRREWQRVRRDEAKILDSLVALKRGGGRPLEWLRERDITHHLVKHHLLELLKQRMGKDTTAPSRAEPRARAARRGTTMRPLHSAPQLPFPPMRDLAEQAHPIEDGDLARFERRLGALLPEPYRQFLVRFNGGVPNPNWFSYTDGGVTREARVGRFFSMGVGGPLDLDEVCGRQRGVPVRSLPVACDTEGGLILLAVAGEDVGVVSVGHRKRKDDPKNLSLCAVTPVSPDFFSFIGNLGWAPGTEPLPAPARRKKM